MDVKVFAKTLPSQWNTGKNLLCRGLLKMIFEFSGEKVLLQGHSQTSPFKIRFSR